MAKRYVLRGVPASVVRAAGGTDITEAPHTGQVFATFTDAQVAMLRARGYVVTEVGTVKPAEIKEITIPIPRTAQPLHEPQDLAEELGIDYVRGLMVEPMLGAGINVAVLDSGVRGAHERIAGRVTYSEDFTGGSNPDDVYDHGTAVASIIIVLVPECNVINMKVIGDSGEGSEESVVMALEKCLTMREEGSDYAPRVANMSFGRPDEGNPNDPIRVACRAAIDQGLWIAASAGNDGDDPETIACPACEELVGAVGSIAYEPFEVSSFSSRGPTKEGLIKPDVVIFGEDFIVASSESDTATRAASGTSFATPLITGIMAIGRQVTDLCIALTEQYGAGRPLITRGELSEITAHVAGEVYMEDLLETFAPVASIKPEGVPPGKDNAYGWGLLYGPLAYTVASDWFSQFKASAMIETVTGVVMLIMMMGMVIPMMRSSTEPPRSGIGEANA